MKAEKPNMKPLFWRTEASETEAGEHHKSASMKSHPEWIVSLPDSAPDSDPESGSSLFNLGLPAARAYMTDLVSGLIDEN